MAARPRLFRISEPRSPQRELGVGRADEAGIPARPNLFRHRHNRSVVAEVASSPARGHTRAAPLRRGSVMRVLFILALLSALAGCAPYIPVKDDFGTSALVPYGDMPPELAEFNRYDPTVSRLLADQVCA